MGDLQSPALLLGYGTESRHRIAKKSPIENPAVMNHCRVCVLSARHPTKVVFMGAVAKKPIKPLV